MVTKVEKPTKEKSDSKPRKRGRPKGLFNPKGGRPKGSSNFYVMKNEVFKKNDLFLYVPEDTLPKGEIKRFLEQCDKMLILLDARTVNNAELEEIAKVYREGVIVDAIFRGLTKNDETSEDGSITLDATTINSLDKILKTVEKRKENLAVRARDRQDARNLNTKVTMMDVVAAVGADIEKMNMDALEFKRKTLEETKNALNTKEFMEEHIGKIVREEDEVSDAD